MTLQATGIQSGLQNLPIFIITIGRTSLLAVYEQAYTQLQNTTQIKTNLSAGPCAGADANIQIFTIKARETMDIRHTFSNQYPQDQLRRRPRKNHPRPPKDPLHSIPAEPPDDGQVDRLLNRMLQLPQELVDLTKEQLLELFFCPGYHLPQILNQDYHKWNKKTHRIARPEMLLLNRSIYHRYAQRMWSENTCAVKTKAGPYVELIPVHGPLDHYKDRFAYIVEQKKEESLWLHHRAHLAYGPTPLYITALHGNPAFPNRVREHWSAIYVQWMIGELPTFHRTRTFAISALKFIETYDSIGAWTSIDLPQKYEEAPDALTSLVEPLDAPWQKMLWKAFMLMVKRKKKYHTEPAPAMANRYREVEAHMYLVGNSMYFFLGS